MADQGQDVSACFICGDTLGIYRDAVVKGLAPQRPIVGNNMRGISFTGPDGYRIDFGSTTDVAEETGYDPALHG